jgi:hypothetical protein
MAQTNNMSICEMWTRAPPNSPNFLATGRVWGMRAIGAGKGISVGLTEFPMVLDSCATPTSCPRRPISGPRGGRKARARSSEQTVSVWMRRPGTGRGVVGSGQLPMLPAQSPNDVPRHAEDFIHSQAAIIRNAIIASGRSPLARQCLPRWPIQQRVLQQQFLQHLRRIAPGLD